MPAKISNTI